MNERIRELAEQAGMNKMNQRSDGFFVVDEKVFEKFAELIVRECAEQGKLIQSQIVTNASDEYNSGREMGIEVFMNTIRKHFGVEE